MSHQMEQWEEITEPDEFVHLYEVSTFGNVRNSQTQKILKPCKRNNSLSVYLSAAGNGRSLTVHSLIAYTFLGPPPRKDCRMTIRHKNGIKTDNRPVNLEWVTHSQLSRLGRQNQRAPQYAPQAVMVPIGTNIVDCPEYRITPDGRIFSYKSNRFMATRETKAGYKVANLYYPDDGSKTVSIHRLVAEYYVPNPHNLRYVNHKNADKLDNRAFNLEWVSSNDNMQHIVNYKPFNTGIKVAQYNRDGTELLSMFLNANEAKRETGIDNSAIHKACKGKVKRAGGHVWKYV